VKRRPHSPYDALMPTVITFTGQRGDKPLTLVVDKDPDEVMAAYNEALGQPFALEQVGGGRVYVQPSTIAFWWAQEPAGAGFP
jgi:hypothetical protein